MALVKDGRNEYDYSTQVYTQSGNPKRVRNCNSFTARNLGDTPVLINDIILFPSSTPATAAGDSATFGGNDDEIFVGKISIAFVQPVGVNPRIEITQKYFIFDKGTNEVNQR